MSCLKGVKNIVPFLLSIIVLLLVYSGERVFRALAAGDLPYTWYFTDDGDYNLSDSSKIEVDSTSQTVRLKIQQYLSDSNTKGLYHLDENTGSTATDSSSGANNGTISGASYTATDFNYGLSFDGISGYVSAPDSTSLNITKENTLEAWIKPASTFSANSSNSNMGIIDKGSYQLYLDKNTGKIVYELAPSTEDAWTQRGGATNSDYGSGINGSWDFNGNSSVSSIINIGTTIYVGLGHQTSDAEVWKYESGTWTQIGGDYLSMDSGLTYSWADREKEEVSAMATDGSNIYVGLGSSSGYSDGEVWKYVVATGVWSKIGGDGTGWGVAPNAGPYEQVHALAVISGDVYAGLGYSAQDGELWRYRDASWTKIGGDGTGTPASWTTGANIEQVYSIAYDASYIYVGLGATGGTDSQVWRCSLPDCTSWTLIGGNGAAGGYSSWGSALGFEVVTSLLSDGDYLYAGMGSGGGDAEIWRFNKNTGSWGGAKWAGDGTGWGTGFDQVHAIVTDGSNIYAALGNTAGENEVWKYNGSTWSQIGGLSTTDDFGTSHTNVKALLYANSTIYAGLQHTSSSVGAELWSYNGSTWTLEGGNYVNKSWGFTGLHSVESSVVVNDKLYIGTGYTTNSIHGNALIFSYDGTTWTIIGGQGVNSSWSRTSPGPYETVNTMANLNGKLYVGLGSSTGDAEVWGWEIVSANTWTQVGGENIYGGWGSITNSHEMVTSMAVHLCSGSSTDYCLFAGLGTSSNDGEVWQYDPYADPNPIWTQIGGVSTGNWGASAGFDRVTAMTIYNGKLIAGLGYSAAGEAEVWEWSGTGTNWTIIGGNNGTTNINSSWDPQGTLEHEAVISLAVFNGDLYAGLGVSTGDGELWKYHDNSWSLVAGDGTVLAESTFEMIKSQAVYNGELYIGLGNTNGADDGEVYRYSGTTWYAGPMGGDGYKSSWPISQNVEVVNTLINYKGKLYAGTGYTANMDAMVWSYGNNIYATSSTASFSNQNYHVAATYDGSSAKIYIDGALDSTTGVADVNIADSPADLTLGLWRGSQSGYRDAGYFNGIIDEVRISNTVRSDLLTTPYTADAQTISNKVGQLKEDVASWAGFTDSSDADGGIITYRLSTDEGSSWKYWGGSAWVTSLSTNQANSKTVINAHISDLSVTEDGIVWQAILDGDGNKNPNITSVTLDSNSDTLNPNPIDTITAKDSDGGSIDLISDNWYNYTSPKFSWTPPEDNGDSGISGYYVYFGANSSAVPKDVADTFQTEAYYIPSAMVTGTPYYLRIQTKDNAQNVSDTIDAFTYKFDSTSPTNPTLLTVSPSGYSSSDLFTFSWPSSGDGIATDTGSQVQGFKYKTGGGTYSSWSSVITDFSVVLEDASYDAEGDANIFYLKTVDNAGNEATSEVFVYYYYAGDGPSAPRFLTVTNPDENTNSQSFSWQPPETYSGLLSEMTYCYTVNVDPDAGNCVYTSPGATSLSAGPFATKVGLNEFHLVAKNSPNAGGAINYARESTVTWRTDTSAPGIPRSIEISDVSIKNQSAWRLALSWAEPLDTGAGIDHYEIFRSEDNSEFSSINDSVTGKAYIDPDLDQVTYYYKVTACDNVNNCGVASEVVSLLPTGRFTEAATLESDPEVTNITTKRATVSWSTNRTSDSKIQYGKGSDDYFDEEPSNSTQVTAHEINLSNLSPGTKYFAVAKWTDEDGNTGISDEFTFETAPAPTVTDPSVKTLGIDNVTLEYTLEGASKVKIYYGLTSAFGGSVELSTSQSEATYLTKLESLQDGTKYYYKINTFDEEDDEYEGNILSFETLPRPKVSDVKIQQVLGTAQPSILVTWNTNTETLSIITYYPVASPDKAMDEINANYITGPHKIILRNLSAQTQYNLVVKARDKAGNQVQSDTMVFTTSTDTRPPVLSDITIESNIIESQDGNATAQLNISWNSDEASTSQIEYGEGTGSNYPQKTQEDKSETLNHMVVINGLTPSKVYHLRVISKDKNGNESKSLDYITITPKASDNALDLVISNLQQIFGAIR